MTYVHTCEFQVRHYECDDNGVLRPAGVLSYLQEAAFDASAAVGYSAHRYDEIGFQWVAYETQLDILHPLKYGDVVQVKTWVLDFRRVRSLRQYEMYRGDQLVCTGTTDWVFINTTTLYPAAITPEIVEAYSRGEAVFTAAPRASFAAFPPAPEAAAVFHRRVEARDLDPAHHVNNAVYLLYVAEIEYLVTGQVLSPLQQVQIEYKNAAKLGDDLDLVTWTEGDLRYIVIYRSADQKLVARVQTRPRGL